MFIIVPGRTETSFYKTFIRGIAVCSGGSISYEDLDSRREERSHVLNFVLPGSVAINMLRGLRVVRLYRSGQDESVNVIICPPQQGSITETACNILCLQLRFERPRVSLIAVSLLRCRGLNVSLEQCNRGTYYSLYHVRYDDKTIPVLLIAQGLNTVLDVVCNVQLRRHAVEDFILLPYRDMLESRYRELRKQLAESNNGHKELTILVDISECYASLGELYSGYLKATKPNTC